MKALNVGRFADRIREAKLVLPPLAEYTDYPYRRILADFNPPFICTEMISAEALLRGNAKSLDMVKIVDGSHLNGAQLVGSNPEVMGKSAAIVEDMGFDYIDINMGCTVKTVTRTGAGIGLMRDEEKASRIGSSIVKAVGLPVTCKMRLGVSKENKNFLSLSRKLVDAGISAVTIHARTGESKFGLELEYAEVRDLSEVIDVPVIVNGGIYDGEHAVEALTSSSADGVMPGRRIIGNPWIIKEINAELRQDDYSPPSLDERKNICARHMEYLCDFCGERSGVILMRRLIGKYFTGTRCVNDMKRECQKARTMDDVHSLINRVRYQSGEQIFTSAR